VVTIRRSRKVLGISLGDRALVAAEVVWTGHGPQIARAAEFAYPPGVTVDHGEVLGEALGDFLRREGFSARRGVVGVPAKWLKVKACEVPPSDSHTAASVVAMQAEKESESDLGAMAFDFTGEVNPERASTLLLMGLPRRKMDRILAVAAGAKLAVGSVTPCATALADAAASTAGGTAASMMLWLRPDGAELSAREGRQTRFLRHLGAAVSGPSFIAELRRAAATLAAKAEVAEFAAGAARGHGGRPAAAGVVLWDGVGLDEPARRGIEGALGMPVTRGELKGVGRNGCGDSEARLGTSAVAVALPLLAGRRPSVDFLHPRLARRKDRQVPRRTAWLAAGGAALVLAALAGYLDLARIRSTAERDERQLDALKPALKTAKPFVANTQWVESFQTGQPRFLACLRDVAAATPPDGRTYLLNFHLQSNMKGEFAGRSGGDKDVVDLMDKLAAGGRFTDLRRKLDARGKSGEVSFSVTFTYAPAGAPAATAITAAAKLPPRTSRERRTAE